MARESDRESTELSNSWTGCQYSVLRIALGAFLLVQFVGWAPWGLGLFAFESTVVLPGHEPLLWLLFRPGELPYARELLLLVGITGALASLLLLVGMADRWAAVWLFAVIAGLYAATPLLMHQLHFLACLILLAHVSLPGAPYGSWAARGRADPGGGWRFPDGTFRKAWIVLSVGYTATGILNLLFGGWWTPEAAFAEGPGNLLDPDYSLHEFLLWLPVALEQLLRWAGLLLQILFAPIAIYPRARPWIWGAMFIVQLATPTPIFFGGITTVFLFLHLITFDPGWLRSRRLPAHATLFYDGTCALCHRLVRFVLAEDSVGRVTLSPIQSDHFRAALTAEERAGLPDSIVLRSDDGMLLEADAAIRVMKMLGGLWLLVALVAGVLPAHWRNAAYRFVAARRYVWFGRTETACPVVPDYLRTRFRE